MLTESKCDFEMYVAFHFNLDSYEDFAKYMHEIYIFIHKIQCNSKIFERCSEIVWVERLII